jgi:hypothetical protein
MVPWMKKSKTAASEKKPSFGHNLTSPIKIYLAGKLNSPMTL